jgi:hypothetical protein
MKAVLEGASYKLSIADTSLRQSFVSFVETGQYRNQESLRKTLILEDEPLTYTEMIATIGWELAENHGVLALLEIKSWEEFMKMLETACVYESEVGQVKSPLPTRDTHVNRCPDLAGDDLHGVFSSLPGGVAAVLSRPTS